MCKREKVNLLVIGSFPPPYHGSSIYLQNLFELITADVELKINVIDTSDHRNDISNLGRFDLINVWTALKSLLKLFITLLAKRVDIVYIPISQNMLAYLRDGLFIILAKLFKRKVVVHLHGSHFFDFCQKSPFIYKNFIDITISKVDGAIVLGEKLRYIFEKWLPRDKIFVLPNFVFKPSTLENAIYENREVFTSRIDKPIRITYLGNIIESKGIFDLIEAVKILLSKGYNILLQIAGKIGKDSITGKSEKETEILISSNIKDYPLNFKFIGQVLGNERFILLKNTDIFVFPSHNEGQPLVILEAMSCGLPIVSTKDCGVIDETVIDGYNGILVEKRNIEQLAKAIETLIIYPEIRKTMGENSYRRYIENYTPSKHLQAFKFILAKILEI